MTGRTRAANELTLYEWDPVSKQPHFKGQSTKVNVERIVGQIAAHATPTDQLVIVLTYYPRSRVIREVTGMAVESLERAIVELSQAALDHG